MKYFRGGKVSFKMRLSMDDFSLFTQNVFRIVKTVPYGETRSYGWVAKKMGVGSSRAIGQALRKNPIPVIIPCHRIIRTSGEIGGFSKGIVVKKRLLEMEKKCSLKF